MESQLGKTPILPITSKLYLQIVCAAPTDKDGYYTLFNSNYWKEAMTPWFYQLLLKGCYYTQFTSNYWKETRTPLQDYSLSLHHPSTIICFFQYSRFIFPSISVTNYFYTSLVSASSSCSYDMDSASSGYSYDMDCRDDFSYS